MHKFATVNVLQNTDGRQDGKKEYILEVEVGEAMNDRRPPECPEESPDASAGIVKEDEGDDQILADDGADEEGVGEGEKSGEDEGGSFLLLRGVRHIWAGHAAVVEDGGELEHGVWIIEGQKGI